MIVRHTTLTHLVAFNFAFCHVDQCGIMCNHKKKITVVGKLLMKDSHEALCLLKGVGCLEHHRDKYIL
jgi:hypothetical protein